MENRKKLVVEYEILPLDYPSQVFQAFFELTGRKLTGRNFIKNNLTTINVWLALRALYVHSNELNKAFEYECSFGVPEYYTIQQTLEHLRGMLESVRLLNVVDHEMTWAHIADCDRCYRFYKAVLLSFLGAIQGRSLEHQLTIRLRRAAEEAAKQMIESARERGATAILITKEQLGLLDSIKERYGDGGLQEFISTLLNPYIKEKKKTELTMEELYLLIDGFEASKG